MPSLSPDSENFHTVLRTMRQAIDLLSQLRIPPTPSRATVAYMYFTNQIDELSRAVNRLLARDKLATQAVDELYQEFFDHAVNDTDLRDASRRFERAVSDVSECIGAAKGKAEHFSVVLGDFRAHAGQTADPALRIDLDTLLAEAQDIAESNRRLGERLTTSSREIVMLREHLERLEREASIDALTGIPNRKAFDVELRKAVTRAGRTALPLSLLMIDIDLFKLFNDNFGHVLGDQVLKLVARTMVECIKTEDTSARYGGEEFCVILPGLSLADAVAVANSIRLHVASKKIVNRRTGISLGTITLSAGAAQYRVGESAGDLIHRADEALYLAKQTGRNRVVPETLLSI